MSEFVSNQRVVSDAEPELGLGRVNIVEHRSLDVIYPACNERRMYARDKAPLHRVAFVVGDKIKNQQDMTITVTAVEEDAGLITYTGIDPDGETIQLHETDLNDLTQLNKPQDRLLIGQLDNENWFRLRYDAMQQLHHLAPLPVHGLCGTRIDLLPHQLYIAHEVANRSHPRVLLADEVGLGKTIEAGLILHQQLITHRANRALIIVPEPLLHQWLVEMMRRFNLAFSLFDETRCEALDTQSENPFESEQLILCSLDFFMQSPYRQQQALDAGWDLFIVDEAHHLHWSETAPGAEYLFIEKLAAQTPGMLLLTATPEQLGAASHFARLRLIDPNRFHDLTTFLEEEKQYQPIADAASELLDQVTLSDATYNTLETALSDSEQFAELIQQVKDTTVPVDQRDSAREALLHQLIDRHGTGRVLFRNTRNAVKGFPLREVHAYPLDAAEEYQFIEQHLANNETRLAFADNFSVPFAQLMLIPETIYRTLKSLGARGMKEAADWWQIDPRVNWLVEQLKALKKKKVLIICSQAETALELEAVLRNSYGYRVGVFHEGLSIIERDRAAAYFSDMEEGAQALICSEIGSEGRNFQFAHHLVLFDLPLNPDLLEQRIGRLDRIGQKHTIQIHAPYIKNSAQEAMFHWYNQGLFAFTRTCPAGSGVYEALESDLTTTLESNNLSTAAIEQLITKTKPVYNEINQRLESGRDRLLELNSFRSNEATQIQDGIIDEDLDPLLADFTARICDAYGVEYEDHSAHSYIIQPSDHMQVHHFPELKDEPVTITYHRQTALTHEDRWFVSWEHPMIAGAIDMLLSSERGNSCLSVCQIPGISTGSIFLECLFQLEVIADRKLQANQYLPPTIIRYLLDTKNNNQADRLSSSALVGLPVKLGKKVINQVITGHQDALRNMLEKAKTIAQTDQQKIIDQALQRMETQLGHELERLETLKKVNPSIRQDELDALKQQRSALRECLRQPQLRLDAVRLIIAA